MKTSGKPKPEKAAASGPDAAFAPVAAAFAGKRGVSGGMMMSSYGLKVGGKIFAMSWKGRLVVKLPKDRVDELVRDRTGRRFDPGHGRLMKEWIVVAPGKAGWVELADEAYRFVKQGGAKP